MRLPRDVSGDDLAKALADFRPAPGGHLAYLGVFVQPVRQCTRLYMGAIAPLRRLVVHPAIIRAMQKAWAVRHGGESGVESRVTVEPARPPRRPFRLVPRRRMHQNDAQGGLHGRVYSQPAGLGA